jgi:integrase
VATGYARSRRCRRGWAAAAISSGPVFRPVLKGGRLQDAPLSPFSAAQIVKHYAERAGLDAGCFAGHSLRSGFLTSAAESGASIWKMTEVSRHKSVDVLRGYVRQAYSLASRSSTSPWQGRAPADQIALVQLMQRIDQMPLEP